jgi:hypothetical protein
MLRTKLCRDLGIEVPILPAADGLTLRVSAQVYCGREDIDAFLHAMGRSVGPPWQAKHKLAAAAALAATGVQRG